MNQLEVFYTVSVVHDSRFTGSFVGWKVMQNS
jgi:hypothetical protein